MINILRHTQGVDSGREEKSKWAEKVALRNVRKKNNFSSRLFFAKLFLLIFSKLISSHPLYLNQPLGLQGELNRLSVKLLPFPCTIFDNSLESAKNWA